MLRLFYGSLLRARESTIRDSNAWVVWDYDPNEWIEFGQRDREHQFKDFRSSARLLAGIAIVIAITALVVNFIDHSFRGLGLLLVLFLVLVSILSAGGLLLDYAEIKKTGESIRRGPREVRIYASGAYIGERRIPFVGLQIALLRVFVRPDDKRVLRFLVSGGRSSRQYEIWLPIPNGREAEAAQLASRFQREIVRSR